MVVVVAVVVVWWGEDELKVERPMWAQAFVSTCRCGVRRLRVAGGQLTTADGVQDIEMLVAGD